MKELIPADNMKMPELIITINNLTNIIYFTIPFYTKDLPIFERKV